MIYGPVYLVAIVFVPKDEGEYDCKKYVHNIKNTQHYKGKFCNDMKRKFPTAEKVNFYNKQSQEFLETIHLE